MTEFRNILVPYDFSPHARAALSTAVALAQRLGAQLHLIHVVQSPSFVYGYGAYGAAAAPPPVDMATLREGAMQSLQAVADGVEDLPKQPAIHVVEGTSTAEMIREEAEELGADLIVMGTHGRTGLAHVFLGSVAERTLRRAPCPVLTVQAPEEKAA